jgi:hypothetical protein
MTTPAPMPNSDKLGEILERLTWTDSNTTKEPLTVAQARAQIEEYFLGIVGEDEEYRDKTGKFAGYGSPSISDFGIKISHRNALRAELRHKLKGERNG